MVVPSTSVKYVPVKGKVCCALKSLGKKHFISKFIPYHHCFNF